MERIVVGICGASGAILAIKTIKALIDQNIHVELVMTLAARKTLIHEIGEHVATPEKMKAYFDTESISTHSIHDIGANIASGSYATKSMLIVPCSMSSVAAIAHGLCDNLLRRAADVTLKEKRALVVVPREAPLSEIHLENLLKLARLGATIIPPMPAWYHHPQTLDDMEDRIVGRILDALKVENSLKVEWQGIK
ncbi:MAG: putative UbiX-like flavin prenyltransferase [Chlamydiae bacterium]|nr:putative UbiX-like flavin prenyltransferase [Chlamydiota bacterium]